MSQDKTVFMDGLLRISLLGGEARAFLAESTHLVERARALYLPRAAAGLLATKDDLAFAFHGTRFSIAYSQALPGFFHMLEQDLVAELAGVTAKPDNPLVLFLGKGLASLQQLAREMAIVRGGVALGDDGARASGSVTLQYGGSLHYALSAMPDRDGGLGALLPAAAQAATAGTLWPELSAQMLERLGEAAQAVFPEAGRARAAALGRDWAALFAKADLQATATGVVPGAGRLCGPVAVTLMRWGDPTALPGAWAGLTKLLGEGPAAEALSERGVKWEIVTDAAPEAIDGKWLAWRTRVYCHPLDFSLPGIMAGTQRYLTALHGDTLVIVAPTAPLELDQYRVAEPHLLAVLAGALRHLANPGAGAPPPPLAPLPGDGTFFRAAAHPLRLAQLALQSETVWPQPGEADRLPVPWGTYAEEFNQFPAKGAPVEFTLGNRKNQLCFSLTVPEATLAECAAAFLDCRAPAKAAPGKGKRARPPLPPVATIPAAPLQGVEESNGAGGAAAVPIPPAPAPAPPAQGPTAPAP